MKKLLLLAFNFLIVFAVSAGGEGWETKFNLAQEKAVAENKSLLVDFTGSDWCGWCIRLKKEVFDHKEFSDFAKEKFVLVEIDYPKSKEQSAEIKAQNEELKNKYKIQGYPTILLMDAQGRPFAKTGYQAGGPSAYNMHLTTLLKQGDTIAKAFADAKKESGVNQAKKLNAALSLIPDELKAHYKAEIEMMFAADPKDSLGFKKSMELNSSLKVLQGKVAQIARKGDVAQAEKLVEDFIVSKKLSGENKQKALMAKLNCYDPRQEGVLAIADKLMDQVIAIDAKSQTATLAKSVKGQIAQMKAQSKKGKAQQ
ncbi:thioredoxin family protein [Lentisphaera profundi]|uniref:Thioredoxin family protein n=1 Tax=Lentisphaera profundi TaxID=1658616 RepID=A0ABY7VZ64_9BACT|nr:thioredoxin family protein [Lentisphaera profundi]WDE98157.1 thioredoxin family protein [Lentisphaera profundi]